MKLFSCHRCNQTLFFESVKCTRCGHTLAFLPDRGIVSAVDQQTSPQSTPLWQAVAPDGDTTLYRLCRIATEFGACNWAIPNRDRHDYCSACRLNQMIPNLGDPAARAAWLRMETAKRRFVYTLLDLGLPVESKDENPDGLAFSCLQNTSEEE